MLVLPVNSRTLVFWPMLFGSLLAVCLWAIHRAGGLPFERAGDSGRDAVACARRDRVMVSGIRLDAAQASRAAPLIGSFATLALGSDSGLDHPKRSGREHAFASVLLFVYLAAAALALAFAASRPSGAVIMATLVLRERSAAGAAHGGLHACNPRGRSLGCEGTVWYEWRLSWLVVVGFLCGRCHRSGLFSCRPASPIKRRSSRSSWGCCSPRRSQRRFDGSGSQPFATLLDRSSGDATLS